MTASNVILNESQNLNELASTCKFNKETIFDEERDEIDNFFNPTTSVPTSSPAILNLPKLPERLDVDPMNLIAKLMHPWIFNKNITESFQKFQTHSANEASSRLGLLSECDTDRVLLLSHISMIKEDTFSQYFTEDDASFIKEQVLKMFVHIVSRRKLDYEIKEKILTQVKEVNRKKITLKQVAKAITTDDAKYNPQEGMKNLINKISKQKSNGAVRESV